jgi:sugar lactone lactonase YvrE
VSKLEKKRRLALWIPLGLLGLVLGYLLAWPAPIDPLAFEANPAPALSGPLAPNHALSQAERLGEGQIDGPETVAVDAQGRIYGGTHDGKIVRMAADGSGVETFAETGGRPLGLAWDARGRLIVADALQGLLAVSPDGQITTLTTGTGGVPFRFTDDVDVATDGRIYFSDASDRFGYGEHMLDLLEARPHGRLLRYDPARGTTEVLLDGLYFANGVAVAADDSFVLVNETYRFRVRRYWLSGPKAGTSDIFADDLPGYPDGISRSPRGSFWVAVFTPRNGRADSLGPRPFLKKVVSRLPEALRPKPERYGLAVELGADGSVLGSLHDPSGERVATVTSAEEVGGALYLGTLHEPYLARVPLDGK